jgi:hypothetical protein
MAALRAIQGMKQDREEDHFPVMRVYIFFVKQLTAAIRQYGGPASSSAALPPQQQQTRPPSHLLPQQHRQFLRNYFRSPAELPELQVWKDALLCACLDIVMARGDGASYVQAEVVTPQLARLRAMSELSGAAGSPAPIPSYLFPTTKPSLRMDMVKVGGMPEWVGSVAGARE